jgi:hypothetical protein
VPAELVTACQALPGTNINGRLDCIGGAALSPKPQKLVTACTQVLTGTNINGVLACIANRPI